ncbi:MAG TPA: hypothetical protein VMD91_11320 [Candidatus Sulfotelmatobacter sp.]|nr:hypothetical protein [Candidatus Sulfotelmatobacter sp.]
MTDHLGEDAELYALGMLSDRREEIEAHLRMCATCTDRVRAAEEVGALLAATLPPVPGSNVVRLRPRGGRAWWPLALAAAFVLVVGGVDVVHERALGTHVAQTDTALLAMASAHFMHTTLAGRPGVIAKAIYARDGAWCYVVADGVPAGAHVVVTQHGARRDLGALAGTRPATLFVRRPGRVSEFAIVAGTTVEASGIPGY